MKDITEYSDNELSLIVLNDEVLYNMRRQILRDGKLSVLSDIFKYTDEQLDVLLQDIKDDLGEE